jgi:hypothetical protein
MVFICDCLVWGFEIAHRLNHLNHLNGGFGKNDFFSPQHSIKTTDKVAVSLSMGYPKYST